LAQIPGIPLDSEGDKGDHKMPIRDCRDLSAWEKAYDPTIAVYSETSSFPVEERYCLTLQLRKAAVSVPSNIAEGEGRNSRAEFRHFLFIALGSVRELETQIYLSKDLGYLRKNAAERLLEMAAEVGRLIRGLSQSISNRMHKPQ
jgi:four helix bundle protein